MTKPDDSRQLARDIRDTAGVKIFYNAMNEGVDLTGTTMNGVTVQACDALIFHGFLGAENKAVGYMTTVTYTASQRGIFDGFVYIVSDGKGGTSNAVITVRVEP